MCYVLMSLLIGCLFLGSLAVMRCWETSEESISELKPSSLRAMALIWPAAIDDGSRRQTYHGDTRSTSSWVLTLQ